MSRPDRDCEQVVGLLTEIRDLLAQHIPPSSAPPAADDGHTIADAERHAAREVSGD